MALNEALLSRMAEAEMRLYWKQILPGANAIVKKRLAKMERSINMMGTEMYRRGVIAILEAQKNQRELKQAQLVELPPERKLILP